jgi:hypothetical protein
LLEKWDDFYIAALPDSNESSRVRNANLEALAQHFEIELPQE